MTKKDHDVLVRLEQKVEDLHRLLQAYGEAASTIPRLSESLRWVTRAVIGAYAVTLTAAIGTAAALLVR